jgi:hypothetical protein
MFQLELSSRADSAGGTSLPREPAAEADRYRLAGAIRAEKTLPPPSEHAAPSDALPRYSATEPPEPALPDVAIRRSEHGETLAVVALLLPLVAEGGILVCRFDSLDVQAALSSGTVAVTALLLAVDAAFLGTVDLHGTRRTWPLGLFFGILLLWIIMYPAAFFRRRDFGRPNLGPLAIAVAVFFVAAPFVQAYVRFGTALGGVPSCTSREVIDVVNNMIRTSPDGPAVQFISGHREIKHDPMARTRTGQCVVKTRTETFTVHYHVMMINTVKGTFQVQIERVAIPR